MALYLGDDVLARQGRSIDLSAQGIHDITKDFIAGNGIIGVLDPELDCTYDLALVLGEGGSVDDDLARIIHCGYLRVAEIPETFHERRSLETSFVEQSRGINRSSR